MKIKNLIVVLSLVSISSQSAELIKDKAYRARTTLEISDGTKKDLKVGPQSKFIVLSTSDKDKYAIKFRNIYLYGEILPADERKKDEFTKYIVSDVIKGEIYFLDKNPTKGIPVEDKVEQSFSGLVSGPLIVPFKYRLNDKSLAGDATVGYYAGWGVESNFFGLSETHVTFTPFISAGLAQVSVLSEAEDGTTTTNSKSGFSWATGLLIKNWDSVNIGIVYGQDRVGDTNWKHEGKGWFSISVGWEI
jgi:hypothetical protein